jgi:hypothetical protein
MTMTMTMMKIRAPIVPCRAVRFHHGKRRSRASSRRTWRTVSDPENVIPIAIEAAVAVDDGATIAGDRNGGRRATVRLSHWLSIMS